MIQKDYIMRLIEQMGKILAKVLLNKEEGKQEDAIKEIDNSFGTLVGIDSTLLKTLPIENVAEIFGISKDKSSGSMKCLIAAKLLKEKSQILKGVEIEESIESSHKALCLYLRGMLNIGYTEIDLTSYIDETKSIAMDLYGKLSIEEMYLLFAFHRKMKEYSKAEDYLFHLKDANYPDIKRIGLAFLKELEKSDETDLAQSGLSIEEIKESIEIFENI